MHWLRRLFFRKQLRAELDEEMRQHLEERTEALMAQGLPREDAERAARRAMGNLSLSRERSEEVWQWRRIESLWADLRFALYQLRKSPGYTLTAVLTLAIGIGANAAIFTLIDDAMLRTLPVPQANELVNLDMGVPGSANPNFRLPMGMVHRLDGHTASLSGIASWSLSQVSLPDDQKTMRLVGGEFYSGNMFALLGLHPFIGRLLRPADDVPGGPQGEWPVDLDYDFWKTQFNGNEAVIGTRLQVSGRPAVIVGVLPPDFHGLVPTQHYKLYLPLHLISAIAQDVEADPYLHPESSLTLALGRLRPGARLSSLRAELAAASGPLKAAVLTPEQLDSAQLRHAVLGAEPGARGLWGIGPEQQHSLILLQCLVLLVLLLCCINLAGLQMARMQERQHEFAVRAALGASTGRILQQTLIESLLLTTLGAAFAILIAWAGARTLGSYLSLDGPAPQLNWWIIVCTLGLSLFSALLSGLLPGLFAGRTPPALVLKSISTNRRGNSLHRRILVPGQLALALVLVFGAGLFTQTLVHLREAPKGFRPKGVVQTLSIWESLKKSGPEVMEMDQELLRSLRSSPGVRAASYTNFPPLESTPRIEAASSATEQTRHSIAWNQVGDGYFKTMGIRLLSGREFTSQDRNNSTCILNVAAMKILYGSSSGMEQTVEAVSRKEDMHVTCRVVGIVEDARTVTLTEPAAPTLYLPITPSFLSEGRIAFLLIRSDTYGDAVSAYRAALSRYAPDAGYVTPIPLSARVDDSLGSERLIALLSGAFAAIALGLSAIGLFGMLSLQVQQRMPEIGIRMALGASRSHVVGLVLDQALRMVGAGLLVGAVLALAAGVAVRSFLYGTSVLSPSVILVTVAALTLAALAAVALPARRVSSLDPSAVLRQE